MAKKVVSVEVESSGYDLGLALAAAVKAAKAAHSSGVPLPIEVGQDLVSAVSAFAPVAGEMADVAKDLAEDKVEFLKGLNLAGYVIYDSIKG
jgi:hypothetical protein